MGRRERALNSLPLEVYDDYDRWVCCDDCDQPIPIGGWPFCASASNPEGHTRGAYGFRMGFKMATQGWTRREK